MTEGAFRRWKVFEAPGVEPVFPEKRQAIDYAETRACFRSGEIRVLDSTGKVEHTISFSEMMPSVGCSIQRTRTATTPFQRLLRLRCAHL
jgi:hypothetical protein